VTDLAIAPERPLHRTAAGWPGATLAAVEPARAPQVTVLGAHTQAVLDIHERHGRALFGFAVRLGLDHDGAEDAVQETMLRLFRVLVAGEAVADARAWCFHTLYRVVIDEHRLQARWAAIRDRLLRRPLATIEPDADAVGRISIWATVDRLPQRQRQVLYLRYRADLPFEEIGTILGMTAGGARRTAAKGLERLRLLLRPNEERG
jgi:RNA polymerase sigma factor (sigma-70 family)